MVLEDVVDSSADSVPEGVFHYSTGGFGMGALSAQNCWGGGFLPATFQTDLGGELSPSFFSPILLFVLMGTLHCYRGMEKWIFLVQTLLW